MSLIFINFFINSFLYFITHFYFLLLISNLLSYIVIVILFLIYKILDSILYSLFSLFSLFLIKIKLKHKKL